MSDFAKFQWSKFRHGKDEQFVVRGDSWEEFKEDIEKIQDKFFDFAAQMEEPPTDEELPSKPEVSHHNLAQNTGFCEQHKVQMKKNVNGKWYHRKFEDGKASFCNGYGFN